MTAMMTIIIRKKATTTQIFWLLIMLTASVVVLEAFVSAPPGKVNSPSIASHAFQRIRRIHQQTGEPPTPFLRSGPRSSFPASNSYFALFAKRKKRQKTAKTASFSRRHQGKQGQDETSRSAAAAVLEEDSVVATSSSTKNETTNVPAWTDVVELSKQTEAAIRDSAKETLFDGEIFLEPERSTTSDDDANFSAENKDGGASAHDNDACAKNQVPKWTDVLSLSKEPDATIPSLTGRRKADLDSIPAKNAKIAIPSRPEARSPPTKPVDDENHENVTSVEYDTLYGRERILREDGTYTARFLEDNGLQIIEDESGRVTARPPDLKSITHEQLLEHLARKKQEQDAADAALREESKSKVINRGKSENVVEDGESSKVERRRAATTNAATLEAPPAKKKAKQSANNLVTPATVKALPASTSTTNSAAPKKARQPIKEVPATVVPQTGFNVVLTHATADFDSLASAVGLAKLWSGGGPQTKPSKVLPSSDEYKKTFDSASHVPTFVVLPRGAHPGVHKFLALHKHLFPIRSLKSLPSDLSNLNRLALVDAQRRDRIGPAEPLLQHAKRITVVDHHIDQDSDIPATDYVVDKVGSVSTLICELLQEARIELTEVEATLFALGIHADTGSLRFDSTTPRDAKALAWCLEQGASQAAIAEHAQSSLSSEQQGVLTQALINANSTDIHGVTLTTVLLSADGFINGLAAVAQDALELSSSDIFLLCLVYEAQSGGRRKRQSRRQKSTLTSRLLSKAQESSASAVISGNTTIADSDLERFTVMYTEAWKGGEEALRRQKLRQAFDRKDVDGSGYLDPGEVSSAVASLGVIASEDAVNELFESMDEDGNGKIDFEEFYRFATTAEQRLQEQNQLKKGSTTMIIVGRVKAGVNLKAVKLNKMLERFGGGGHAKAASATVRLNEESEASGVLQGLVDELVSTSLQKQPTVGDFMVAPVLSVKPEMTEKQVEDLFTRYDVRALPVVDENNDVIGLVTYKEVASAKQRLWNKEQKRLRQEREAARRGEELPRHHQQQQQGTSNDSSDDKKNKAIQDRKRGTTVKGWMLQHVKLVEASKTMSEVESILLENDVGCIPVVADGTRQLVGMVTRTDLLRQHRYYASLHYHNKGYADSIANRKPIIALRKRLKRYDLEE